MKSQWLNLVLRLTNTIFAKKQKVIEQEGLGVIVSIFVLFVYEILLSVISLPLYIGLRSAKVTAFLREKGGYEKISYDYNLRRVLTLTGVSIVFVIWFVKLMLILMVPNIYGPLQLYKVSDLEPVDLMREDLISGESRIQTAKTDSSIAVPEVIQIEKKDADNYIFYGKGQPSTTVVLFLSDNQTAVLSDSIDEQGNWEIAHSQDDLRLSEGNHSVVAFSYDDKIDKRSDASTQKFFKIKTSYLDRFIKNVDLFVNSSVVVVVGMGILLTVLTL